MDYIILFDDPKARGNLLPFTFTRPVADIRLGILKVREKWEKHLSVTAGTFTEPYLQSKFPYENRPALFINGCVCPDEALVQAVSNLKEDESLWKDGMLLAAFAQDPSWFSVDGIRQKNPQLIQYDGNVRAIQHLWNLFQYNGEQIREDFKLVTKGRASAGTTDPYTYIYNNSQVFIEPGATIKASIINAESGPVYIGKNAQVLEGNLIKGPFVLCQEAVLSMGSKMRGDITIGPKCKVGGEVSNSLFFGYSNKSHDGYLGNSVVGEWCNLGANTNTSNMKNNLSSIRVWNYEKDDFEDSGLKFCGSFIGDHTKLGISTMLNSGTVVGVGANVFGEGFPKKRVPSFAWGGITGFSTFKLKKFEETTEKVTNLKNESFSTTDQKILQHIYEITRPYRIWDKES